MCRLYRRKAAGGINIRLFVFHINREPLLFSLIVTLRQLWAGLHLQKALRWKLALTCTQGRRLWYLCCWESIWTPEANCPPLGRSWPDGSLLGGSLEVPAPFWSRGPHHLRADMKEARLEKVPVCWNATRRRHKVMYHQRWSKYAGPSSIYINQCCQLHRNPQWYRRLFMPIPQCEQTNRSNHAKVIATCFYKGGEIFHDTSQRPRTKVSSKPFKSSICGFLHTSQEQGCELWFEKKGRLRARTPGCSESNFAVFPLKLRQINCAVQWLFLKCINHLKYVSERSAS